jgi:hypothetical protein
MVFHIERGRYGNVALDGLNFVIITSSPGIVGDGYLSAGVIVDERATPEQREALTMIASGQGGGPIGALGPLITNFLGVEVRPIHFQKDGMRASVSIPGMLDQGINGVPSALNPEEPLHLDNTLHPANSRLGLAKATHSHLHAFALNWDDEGGSNNGFFAPFEWRS